MAQSGHSRLHPWASLLRLLRLLLGFGLAFQVTQGATPELYACKEVRKVLLVFQILDLPSPFPSKDSDDRGCRVSGFLLGVSLREWRGGLGGAHPLEDK